MERSFWAGRGGSIGKGVKIIGFGEGGTYLENHGLYKERGGKGFFVPLNEWGVVGRLWLGVWGG